METYEPVELLRRLLAAKSADTVRTILSEIGDTSQTQIGEKIGRSPYSWHPFGNNLSNISTIGLATKPGRSLTERLTNAMDALLEDRASPGMQLPTSSRAAAQQWFGRPVSGPDEGLFNWVFNDSDYDRRIAIVLHPSGVQSAPTVDVLDQGVGLTPAQLPSTILSLQSGNKINKRYLIGAFGQGGSSTLAFCDYALILSRSKADPKVVGFTIIRVVKLDETYKEDTYAYLSVAGTDGKQVPMCEIGEEPLEIYEGLGLSRGYALHHGTLVRHFSYKLTNLVNTLSPSPGNLYHYLHCLLFDPLFPFRAIDVRDPNSVKDERINGSRNRLMRLVKRGDDSPDPEGRIDVRHYCPMEYVVPVGSDAPSIGIEYWVVLATRKGTGKKKDELVLRGQSNELFVQAGHPIIATMNGQNQGELTSKLLRDLGLGMLSRHMVIHLDATNADSRVRRELFATSREGMKDGPVLEGLLQVLRKMLAEDETLAKIEQELTDKLSQKETHATDEEVKREVSKLLREAGYRVKDPGPSTEPGEQGEEGDVTKHGRRRPAVADPLPTLPYPEVTRFEIVHPKPEMQLAQNDNEVVLVETDADAQYDREKRIAVRFEPDVLELAAVSPLRGGRMRWRLRAKDGATVGQRGKIIATMTKPNGTQLMDSTDFEILPPEVETTRKSRGDVPPFEIVPINPTDDQERWGHLWPQLDSEQDPRSEEHTSELQSLS